MDDKAKVLYLNRQTKSPTELANKKCDKNRQQMGMSRKLIQKQNSVNEKIIISFESWQLI